jgi:hypothetical protein
MDWNDWPGQLELLSLDELKKRYEEGDTASAESGSPDEHVWPRR